ncbi:hypothetical protein [Variovorax gossypii]
MKVAKMHLSLKLAAANILAMSLVACGGGGSDSSAGSAPPNGASPTSPQPAGEDNVTASDAQVVANVKSSNIDFLPGNRPAGTWRWSGTPAQKVAVYVPAPATSTEQDYAAKVRTSIAQINTKLSGSLVMETTDTLPASGNFIRVSYGTSYVPAGSTNYAGFCANVATGPNVGNPIQPDNQNGIASSPVYVNLGNGRCDVTQDIVTHEFGHALGLAYHFDGFGGDGPATSTAFWDVLATLYGNPQSTVASNLAVKRAAK